MLPYRGGMEDRRDEPVRITDAKVAASEELRHRQNRYLISMLIRTACVLLAVLVPGWGRWFFVAGAVFLPYVSVVLANTANRRKVPDPDVLRPEPIGELGPGDDVIRDDENDRGERP